MKTSIASKIYAGLIFLFLYLPIAVIVVFSFNAGDLAVSFEGFSFRHYISLFTTNFAAQAALRNTLVLAASSSVITVLLGTATAVGIDRMRRNWTEKLALGINNIPLMSPEIVMGISMMMLFTFGGQLLGQRHVLGFSTLLIAHITFCLPYVILSVLPKLRQCDPHLAEAAQDLGCSQLMAFFKVTLPAISTGIASAFLIAFTLSLDNFVISRFTAGHFQTLPMHIFGQIRRFVRPDMYAMTTLIFVTMFLLLLGSNLLQIRADKKKNHNTGRKHI